MPFDTFATLVNRNLVVPSERTAYMAVDRDFLIALMQPMLATINFDEPRYVESHQPARMRRGPRVAGR